MCPAPKLTIQGGSLSTAVAAMNATYTAARCPVLQEMKRKKKKEKRTRQDLDTDMGTAAMMLCCVRARRCVLPCMEPTHAWIEILTIRAEDGYCIIQARHDNSCKS
jgi:hypothetical protein